MIDIGSRRVMPAVMAILVLLLCGRPAAGQEDKSALNLFVDGVEQFDLGNYKKALDSLRQALELAPGNLQYRYYVGLTRKAQGKEAEALEIFNSVVDADPRGFTLAYFEIAAIHSGNGRFQEAVAVLERAEAVMPDNGRVFLEKGLAYREMDRYQEAVASFEKAMRVDSGVTQAAYYNIAATHFAAGDFEAAEAMYNQAIHEDPNSAIAANARASLANLSRARRNRKPWYLSGAFAWGYDSNVPLDPLEGAVARAPGQPSGKSDVFQVLKLNGGYKLINSPKHEAGIGYEMRCTGYQDWTANNLLAHRPHLYYRHNGDPFYFRIKYDFSTWHEGGEGFLNQEVFLLSFGNDSSTSLRMSNVESSLTIMEPHDMMSEITLNYQYREFVDDAISDSIYYAAELTQSFKWPGRRIYPRLGYKYGHDDTDVDADGYRYNQGYVGVSLPMPWKVQADAALYYARIDFNFNPSYAASGEREDDQYRLTASLSRRVTDLLSLKLYYDFTDNDSNVTATDGTDPFEFRKHITSLILTAAF